MNVDEYKIGENEYKCPHCDKIYKKLGLGAHIWAQHTEEGILYNKNRKFNDTKIIWNKGLTKDSNESVLKMSNTLKEKYKNNEIINAFKGKTHTKESIKKIAAAGGPRKGSGRGKKGWYKGYWCDSSWELAFVIYNLDHNIEFIRNTKGFDYLFNNKKYKYYPDFILNDGTYVEIKGYLDEKAKYKILAIPNLKLILGKNENKIYLDYVIELYGVDFVKLYDKI
jgi:uncharacterized C2H2 Zn-finger protein